MSSFFQQYIGLQSFCILFDGCIGATCNNIGSLFLSWLDKWQNDGVPKNLNQSLYCSVFVCIYDFIVLVSKSDITDGEILNEEIN